MAGSVDITLPDGSAASVPQADLSQALAAGATIPKAAGAYESELGGGLGQAASFALGAGRTASFGLMDGVLVEGANIAGGDQARREMLHGLNVAKETNQYATMGGEAAGLFLGAGEGVMAAGGMVEEQAAARLGHGLMGRVGSMAARGGVEGAMLGVQHQITEDTLGDHAYTAEKLVAAAEKDALLGAGIGGGLGALGHFGSEALAGLRHSPGPRSARLLDEVAGLEGAGVPLREEAGEAEALVKDLQKAGATSEQAAVMADEVSTMARARTSGGPLSGLLDEGAARFAATRAGGNEEMREVLERGFLDRSRKLAGHEAEIGNHALAVTKHGSELMRAEETLNRINFTERPDQFAKLLDPSKIDAAADAAALMTQKLDGVVSSFEREALMGGEAVQVRQLRKALTSTYSKQAALVDATGAAREGALRDMYMDTYKLKQKVGEMAGFGKSAHMRSPSESMFNKVYEDLRVGLEDESVWGRAGAANREWNETFSQQLPRRQDFAQRFGVSIDQVSGIPRPEVDFEKSRGFLKSLSGNQLEDDALQGMKSAGSYTDGLRARMGALEKYADMSAADRAVFEKARTSADSFDTAFAAARKDSAVIARLRTQALEEQGKSLGGVLGLATDIMTRPLQTMERLGVIKATTERFEKGIENAMNRFFEGKGSALMRRGTEAADEVVAAARPREAVTKEIGDLREIAGNAPAMQERVSKMLGDLSSYAPKIADAAGASALRLMTYLADEAPVGRAERSMLSNKTTIRYSDQELSVYETKRTAAVKPESVITEMRAGKLNRDGIRAVKATSPRIFAKMQEIARDELIRREEAGTLDGMSYQRKATIACLLEVPPDGTWEPSFMSMMQATKAPQQAQQGEAQQAKGGGRRPIKIESSAFETEAQQIEGRTT